MITHHASISCDECNVVLSMGRKARIVFHDEEHPRDPEQAERAAYRTAKAAGWYVDARLTRCKSCHYLDDKKAADDDTVQV